jgi:hypothetical protein
MVDNHNNWEIMREKDLMITLLTSLKIFTVATGLIHIWHSVTQIDKLCMRRRDRRRSFIRGSPFQKQIQLPHRSSIRSHRPSAVELPVYCSCTMGVSSNIWKNRRCWQVEKVGHPLGAKLLNLSLSKYLYKSIVCRRRRRTHLCLVVHFCHRVPMRWTSKSRLQLERRWIATCPSRLSLAMRIASSNFTISVPLHHW